MKTRLVIALVSIIIIGLAGCSRMQRGHNCHSNMDCCAHASHCSKGGNSDCTMKDCAHKPCGDKNCVCEGCKQMKAEQQKSCPHMMHGKDGGCGGGCNKGGKAN